MSYREERNKMLYEVKVLIDNQKIDEANIIMNTIEKKDKEGELLGQNYMRNKDEHFKERTIKASLNALKDNQPIINLEDCSINLDEPKCFNSLGKITMDSNINHNKRKGEKMSSIFLNKGDKFADHVKISNEDSIILEQDGALGNVIKGMVTGKWVNSEFKNAVTTTSTGTLIPQVLASQIIDQAREISLFTNAGVPVLPMESNNVTVSRIKTDPVFLFKEEGKAVTESTMELDGIELKSKMIYGYAYISLEAIKSSKNLDGVIRHAFSQALAQGIDKAMLYGQYNSTESDYDAFAPAGIMNDTNINTLAHDPSKGTIFDTIIMGVGKVKRDNYNPTHLAINAATEESISTLKDDYGQYLIPPSTYTSLNKVVTNQLSDDETNGSEALVFDPNSMLIGVQENINIKLFEQDTECIKKGLVCFRIYSMIDCVVTQPKAICKITEINKPSL